MNNDEISILKDLISEEVKNFLREQSSKRMKKYKVTYTSESLGEPEFYLTATYHAYDLDHLLDKFYDQNDPGWEIIRAEEIK